MKTLHKLFAWAAVWATLGALLSACDPDAPGYGLERNPEPPEGVDAYVDLPLQIAPETEGMTKATYLSGVESCGSGALVLCYRTATGTFESATFFTQAQLDQAVADPETHPLWLGRVPVDRCDFFVLGNLHLIDKTSGTPVELPEGLGEEFPATRTALENFTYWLDGRDVGERFRMELMPEVKTYGIPYVQAAWNVNVGAVAQAGTGIPGFTSCRRLFAKVNVTIDHSAFDDDGASVNQFVNQRILVRCANTRFHPFRYSDNGTVTPDPYPQKATATGDIWNGANWADYDVEMAPDNAHVNAYTLYVPENMQGTLLGGNSDPAGKVATALGDKQELVTFIQLDATLSVPVAGIGGNVSYLFCLGRDNTSNFDVEGGKEYNVTLGFRQASLWNPYWKVSFDKTSDSRKFRVTKWGDYGEDLGSTSVAVRKNRPGTVYLYANPTEEHGSNYLLGRSLNPDGFAPASLTEYAVRGDFSALHQAGVYESFDASSGALAFSVGDWPEARSAFDYAKAVGAAPYVTLQLLPDGGTQTLQLRFVDDLGISVASGSLSDGFYLAQRRTVTPYGFLGSVSYSESKGAGGWITTPSGSGYVLSATYPTHFQASARRASASGSITFYSDDPFNDGSVSATVNILQPMLYHSVPGGNGRAVVLPIDGTEIAAGIGYYSFDGSSRMYRGSDFDTDLYDAYLGHLAVDNPGGYGEYIGLNESGELYVARTTGSLGNLEDMAFDATSTGHKKQLRLGPSGNNFLNIYNTVLPEIYPAGSSSDCRPTGYISKLIFADVGTLTGYSSLRSDGKYAVSYLYSGVMGAEAFMSTEDAVKSRFGVNVKFFFQNGDFSRVSWSRSGYARQYSCVTYPYETFGPVIDYDVTTADDGSGGVLKWEYNETHQVMLSSSGEPVPGGLILPYGGQTCTATVENKWDHRSFSDSFSFELYYQGVSCSVFVVARPGATTATVYAIPGKAVKYLKRMGTSTNPAGRQWMMKILEDNSYMNNMTMEGAYRKTTGGQGWFAGNNGNRLPRSDYYASYLSQLKNASPSFSTWSQRALDMIEDISFYGRYIVMPTCNSSTDYYGQVEFSTLWSYSRGMLWTKTGENF